jgi:hypothetical protein
VRRLRRAPVAGPGRPVHAIVELPGPLQPAGNNEGSRRLMWKGGIHLLGPATLVIPGRTLNDPDDARAHAAAVLAAAARMEAGR